MRIEENIAMLVLASILAVGIFILAKMEEGDTKKKGQDDD